MYLCNFIERVFSSFFYIGKNTIVWLTLQYSWSWWTFRTYVILLQGSATQFEHELTWACQHGKETHEHESDIEQQSKESSCNA